METHWTAPHGILTARVRKLSQACWLWFKLNLTDSRHHLPTLPPGDGTFLALLVELTSFFLVSGVAKETPAHAIDAGANEIKSAADDPARRTEQQAASVEQTAAALEEITTAVNDSTKRAQEAGVLVARTKAGAENPVTWCAVP
ncbi:hypothetical protein RvVAR0630_32400 [Agrobacterium vitis]|nr:hypothetical protein RvVAR0630_32400 [Agrobacterium vitis]